MERLGRPVEQRGERLELAVSDVQDPGSSLAIEAAQQRGALIVAALDPDSHPAPSHDPQATRPQIGLDRRQVVADDSCRETERRRDRLHTLRLRPMEEVSCDVGLATVERDER